MQTISSIPGPCKQRKFFILILLTWHLYLQSLPLIMVPFPYHQFCPSNSYYKLFSLIMHLFFSYYIHWYSNFSTFLKHTFSHEGNSTVLHSSLVYDSNYNTNLSHNVVFLYVHTNWLFSFIFCCELYLISLGHQPSYCSLFVLDFAWPIIALLLWLINFLPLLLINFPHFLVHYLLIWHWKGRSVCYFLAIYLVDCLYQVKEMLSATGDVLLIIWWMFDFLYSYPLVAKEGEG